RSHRQRQTDRHGGGVLSGSLGNAGPLCALSRSRQHRSHIAARQDSDRHRCSPTSRKGQSLRRSALQDDHGGAMNSTALPLAPERRARRAALLNYFSLFSSFSTLICCALPSVLVLLGLGTTVASLLSAAPWLVSLSRHKIWTFSIAGTLITMSFVMTYLIAPRLQGEACKADDPTTCGEVSKVSRIILWG